MVQELQLSASLVVTEMLLELDRPARPADLEDTDDGSAIHRLQQNQSSPDQRRAKAESGPGSI